MIPTYDILVVQLVIYEPTTRNDQVTQIAIEHGCGCGYLLGKYREEF
jgi:hypothetical protein